MKVRPQRWEKVRGDTVKFSCTSKMINFVAGGFLNSNHSPLTRVSPVLV